MNACEYRILSEDYRDIPLGFDISSGSLFPGDPLSDDKCVIKITDNLYILYVVASSVAPLNSAEYRYQYIPKCYGLQNDLSVLNDAGILQVGREPLSLTGQGVILGFLDTGIRYRLPAFRNEDGSTRLVSVWDQTAQMDGSSVGTGNQTDENELQPPDGFYYGIEYILHWLSPIFSSMSSK